MFVNPIAAARAGPTAANHAVIGHFRAQFCLKPEMYQANKWRFKLIKLSLPEQKFFV